MGSGSTAPLTNLIWPGILVQPETRERNIRPGGTGGQGDGWTDLVLVRFLSLSVGLEALSPAHLYIGGGRGRVRGRSDLGLRLSQSESQR